MLANKETQRDTNMDMMRITAMFLVMVYHINYWGIAQKYAPIISYNLLHVFGYTLMKTVSVVCVNMFILISGWYGIRPRIRKLFGFFFQIWFFSILSYIVFVCLYDDIQFSLAKFAHYIFFSDYWFVPAYLLLYIISPVLNAFVENSTKKNLIIVITCFYLFQFIYGWFDRSPYFDHGCSPLVFVGLYLLARYLRIYNDWQKKITTPKILLWYLVLLFLTTLICTMLSMRVWIWWVDLLLQYSSPFTVCLAVLLLLFFSKIKMKSNRTISIVGTSSFAVYLFHDSTYFYEKIFFPLGCRIFHNHDGLYSIFLLIAFLLVIYAISIFFDSLRILFWHQLTNVSLRITNLISR